jgi:hypothetical protein
MAHINLLSLISLILQPCEMDVTLTLQMGRLRLREVVQRQIVNGKASLTAMTFMLLKSLKEKVKDIL